MPVTYRFLPAIFLITAVAPAAADPITLLNANRFIQATADSVCCGKTNINQTNLDSMALTAVPPLELSPSAAGSATQTSRIIEAERLFYGQGSVAGQVNAPGGVATGQSYYRVTLDLTQPQNYLFTGLFNTTRLNDGVTTAWVMSITDHTAPDTPLFSLRGSDSIYVYQPGTLLPGRYDFLVSLSAISTLPNGVATGSDNFRLEFSDAPMVTPEPASLLLFGSGAALLFVRRRRFP